MRIGDLLRWERTAGESMNIGGYAVTPESQALRVRLPFGGFVWNRPAAILVDDGSGQQRVPVVDVTRTAQLALLASAALFLILGLVFGRLFKSKKA